MRAVAQRVVTWLCQMPAHVAVHVFLINLLAGALLLFWNMRNRQSEGRAWIEGSLERSPHIAAALPRSVRAKIESCPYAEAAGAGAAVSSKRAACPVVIIVSSFDIVATVAPRWPRYL